MPKPYSGIFLSLISGLCAAAGAALAKLAFSSPALSPSPSVLSIDRVVYVALFIGSQVLMWATLTAAFRHSSTTGLVSVINTASNILCSGLIGWLLFNEMLSFQWLAGISLILIGVSIIITEKPKEH